MAGLTPLRFGRPYGLQRISENQLVSGTWTPSFYGYDGHGNVRFLANSSGAITDSHTFDAFGAQIASTPSLEATVRRNLRPGEEGSYRPDQYRAIRASIDQNPTYAVERRPATLTAPA